MTEDAVARARALVGVRFRAQGRDPALGLDCVGVALAVAGVSRRGDYPRRLGDIAGAVAALDAAGLERVATGHAGDVMLIDAGARQLHLAVLVPGGHVHACARAGRVVEVPGPPAGQIIGCWRI
ncbi:hypothetical protein [Sphingomonas jatrophae]|uniref:NlpC/P60 family protein n=1 Tax=Sphingomonas jatrophae TaxID=1166337 RepID=A0A1I6L3B4_9SPHN|nr:hypothetical protein [Sphingomonas jatrophae]SFR97975.1 hypothetical protein SAMN05192580_2232 [Sphingomonas jatrophae]